MKHNVAPDLKELLVPLDKLVHLTANPRRGDTKSIRASYEEFGQTKPIVAFPEDDKFVVIAGNHQLLVARDLGWTHMAVVVRNDWDRDKAIAFALADNRTSELGSIDQDELYEMISSIAEPNYDLLDALEWDDFEIALMEDNWSKGQGEHEDFSKGFTTPTIIEPGPLLTPSKEKEEEEEIEYEGDSESIKDIVTQGATSVDKAGGNPTFQYTLTFTMEQQKEWYEFLRFLKALDEYQGMDTGAQVIAFLRNKRDG